MRPLLAVLLVLAGCGDDDGSADADAGARADAARADAAPPDAYDDCPGRLTFTGDYVDWDSTDTMFKGVFDAEVAPVGAPAQAVHTAPNGRSILCVPRGADLDVDFTQSSYLPVRFGADATVAATEIYTVRGLTPTRAAALFGELGLADDLAALVMVDVRTADRAPLAGAVVSLSAGGTAFVATADGAWVRGATLLEGGGSVVLFAKPTLGDGTTGVTITPPTGVACDARSTIPTIAGGIAFTLAACR
jgi:hypothetical protein